MKFQQKRQLILEPVEIEIRESTYQPSKAEHQEEHDMPGMSVEAMRAAFMRPFKFKRK